VEWDETGAERVSSTAQREQYLELLKQPGMLASNEGDAMKAVQLAKIKGAKLGDGKAQPSRSGRFGERIAPTPTRREQRAVERSWAVPFAVSSTNSSQLHARRRAQGDAGRDRSVNWKKGWRLKRAARRRVPSWSQPAWPSRRNVSCSSRKSGRCPACGHRALMLACAAVQRRIRRLAVVDVVRFRAGDW
jgi:hypothetical protein